MPKRKRPPFFLRLQKGFKTLGQQPRYALMTMSFGCVGAGAAIALALAIEFVFHFTLGSFTSLSAWDFAFWSFVTIMSTSAVVGILLTVYAPEAAGSGIPQLKLAYWERYGAVSLRETWVKFVAGTLSVGGGTSLGREGPSVFLAGGFASHLARFFGIRSQALRPATAAGAAAGLSAAFNTPIAAIFFVLEEILDDLNSRHLGGVIIASVTGALLVYAVLGSHPAFQMETLVDPDWFIYLLVPLVSGLASMIGVAFQRACLYLREQRLRSPILPAWTYPMMGGLVTWFIGITIFLSLGRMGVFGIGYHDLTAALHNELTLGVVLALLVAKFLATSCAYGMGGCGGIFAPTLFFGSMTGLAGAYIVELALPVGTLSPGEEIVLAVVGMSACLGAVVRAPITSILIVFEMTHQFNIVPALMLGTIVSQAISRYFNPDSFYNAVLKQDGAKVNMLMPPRDLSSWLSMRVGEHIRFQRFILRGLEPQDLRAAIANHNVAWFPVVLDEKLQGVVSRFEIERSLYQKESPNLAPVLTASPRDTIGHVQQLLLKSTCDAVVILNKNNNKVLGVITMRALLTEEIAHSQQI